MDKKRSFEELCSDKEFLQKVLVQKNEDDVKKLFAEKGVEVTQQELNSIREILYVILGKNQKLSPSETKEVAGGTLTGAVVQLSSAVTEAAWLLLRSMVEREVDPTGVMRDIRAIERAQGMEQGNLSWSRVYANAINGTLDLDPRLRSAASRITAWWNGR